MAIDPADFPQLVEIITDRGTVLELKASRRRADQSEACDPCGGLEVVAVLLFIDGSQTPMLLCEGCYDDFMTEFSRDA